MGIFSFFKKAIDTAREGQPVKKEHTILKKEKDTKPRRSITDETFNTSQFQREILAFASWKYDENKHDYLAAHKCLIEMEDISLTTQQADEVIETLKLWNGLKNKKDRLSGLVSQAQTLVNNRQPKEAFQLVYNAYLEDHSDIELVELVTQLADIYQPESDVLALFDNLAGINLPEAYNVMYKKALYLKTKERFAEAIKIFEKLNTELPFAWNYYQIAIIQNLSGNINACLDSLKITFELDPDLKQDARNFPELQNLHADERFILLTN